MLCVNLAILFIILSLHLFLIRAEFYNFRKKGVIIAKYNGVKKLLL